MNDMPVFASPLRNLLEQYVAHRRMRGYKAASGEEDIRQFDVYAGASPIATERLTKEMVEAYITRRPGEQLSTQSHRVSTVRCVGKYLVRCGMDAYVLPNGIFTVGKYGFVPHVLTGCNLLLCDVVRPLPFVMAGQDEREHLAAKGAAEPLYTDADQPANTAAVNGFAGIAAMPMETHLFQTTLALAPGGP